MLFTLLHRNYKLVDSLENQIALIQCFILSAKFLFLQSLLLSLANYQIDEPVWVGEDPGFAFTSGLAG